MESTFLDLIKKEFDLKEIDAKQYSPLTLAFIGDAIYDMVVRTIIVEQANAPVNKLHKKVSSIVKASAQMELLHRIKSDFTEEEERIYKRGRNAKSFTAAKNASIGDYRVATGLEALMGYLYLTDQMERIIFLMKKGLETKL